MGLLIVGQQPRRTTPRRSPLNGPSGWRLADWCDMTFAELRRACVIVNLVDHAGTLSSEESREAWRRIWPALAKDRTIILGSAVARAAGFAAPPLEWAELDGRQVALVPHTSGLNRWYNDPENLRRAARFFCQAVRTYGQGDMSCYG